MELVESPPLGNRGDPHKLPFFMGFLIWGSVCTRIEPCFRGGIERTVSGLECGAAEVMRIAKLFEKSHFVDVKVVVLAGERRTNIVMRGDNCMIFFFFFLQCHSQNFSHEVTILCVNCRYYCCLSLYVILL